MPLLNTTRFRSYNVNFFIKWGTYRKVVEDLNAGEMEDRVAHIFMEADHLYVQDVLDAARIYGSLRV